MALKDFPWLVHVASKSKGQHSACSYACRSFAIRVSSIMGNACGGEKTELPYRTSLMPTASVSFCLKPSEAGTPQSGHST